MAEFLSEFGLGIILIILTAAGDFLIKSAADQPFLSGWRQLLAGAFIWAATAVGWFWMLKKMKLSTVGVLYSVGTVIILTLLSIFYFKEKISPIEVVGILMAIGSLLILFRFS